MWSRPPNSTVVAVQSIGRPESDRLELNRPEAVGQQSRHREVDRIVAVLEQDDHGPIAGHPVGDTSSPTCTVRMDTTPGRASEPFHLAKGAGDANPTCREVDRHRAGISTGHAAQAIRVVSDPVAGDEPIDHRVGLRVEGARGEVSPSRSGSWCHHCQYAPAHRIAGRTGCDFGTQSGTPGTDAGPTDDPGSCGRYFPAVPLPASHLGWLLTSSSGGSGRPGSAERGRRRG